LIGGRTIGLAADPDPALLSPFSRKPEKAVAAVGDRGYSAAANQALGAPPLPLAGEGWGEGKPQAPLRRGV